MNCIVQFIFELAQLPNNTDIPLKCIASVQNEEVLSVYATTVHITYDTIKDWPANPNFLFIVADVMHFNLYTIF